MAEHEKRKNARALLTKSGYSKLGGHLTKRPDEIADKHEISEGIHQHEGARHKGQPKTRLKLRDGGNCEGMAAGGRSDRKPRGAKGKGKKGGTTVNVIVAHPHPKPVPVPVPVGAGAGPGGPPPPGMPPGAGPGGPPMPPPDGGGPPMGAKKGGRVGLKKGGKAKGKFPVKMEFGAGGGLGRLEKAKDYGA